MYTLVFGHAWNASDGPGGLDRALETEKPNTFLEGKIADQRKGDLRNTS